MVSLMQCVHLIIKFFVSRFFFIDFNSNSEIFSSNHMTGEYKLHDLLIAAENFIFRFIQRGCRNSDDESDNV